MILCGGCFYTKPTWVPGENEPPEIIRPLELDNVLPLVADVETLTVIAYDPEGTNLFFRWQMPRGHTAQTSTFQDEDLFVSEARVSPEGLEDGDLISCIVIDGDKLDVQLDWTVVLP